MREFFIELFSGSDKGPWINLFGFWHIFYVILIIGLTIFVSYLLSKKDMATKEKAQKIIALILVILYFGDFFIQPFYNHDNLIIDKLPFHICTLMCPMIIFVCVFPCGKKISTPIAVLSLVSSLMYLTYPGSAIGEIGAFSYQVLQTFIYHGVLFAYGFCSIALGLVKIEYKKIYKELIIIASIAIWATIGNTLYSTIDHPYDWFFVSGNTYPFIPKPLMPFVVISAIFLMVNLIYLIYFGIKKYLAKKALNKD